MNLIYLSFSFIHINIFFFFLLYKIYVKGNEICNFIFTADILYRIYDKFNNEKYEQLIETDECNNLNSLNAVRSFWDLKMRSICTESTTILNKQVMNKICNVKYKIPHIIIKDLNLYNEISNIEFICAHFIYDDNEIIKCIKKNESKNYTSPYFIGIDLYVPTYMLNFYNKLENNYNFKSLETISYSNNIINESLCKIHSHIYNIMTKEDILMLKLLMGLCTKLGFHKHFIITDNIHPLFNLLSNKYIYNLSTLNFKLENTIMLNTNYEYFLNSFKLTEVDYTLSTSMSSSTLTLYQKKSFIAWAGLKKDGKIYDIKLRELYKRLNTVDYMDKINYCYDKYTSSFYESNKYYFNKYLSEEKKNDIDKIENVFVDIISDICKDIKNVHQCIEKIISLNGVYDYYFKNFMINFIYYNTSCPFNCNFVDMERIFSDNKIWKLYIRYFSNSYLVNYKKKKNMETYSKNFGKVNNYYMYYDYDYIHSGKWRNMSFENEDSILKYSVGNIQYEFYNYTYNLLDLNTYNYFIVKNEETEDNICKIAYFTTENGKKYTHTNTFILNLFNKNNRILTSDEEIKKYRKFAKKNYNDEEGNEAEIEDEDEEEEEVKEEKENENKKNSGNKNTKKSFDNNFFDNIFDSENFLNLFKNNDLLNDNKLFENIFNHDELDDEYEEEEEEDDDDDDDNDNADYEYYKDDLNNERMKEDFNIENHKIETKKGFVYPLKHQYTYEQLKEVFEIHPGFIPEKDKKLRRRFFRSEYFKQPVAYIVENIPTKIKDYQKIVYNIKKEKNVLTKQEEKNYNQMVQKYNTDPNIFSKINIFFKCSKNGIWPVRNSRGSWISDILCEAYNVPQLNKIHKENGDVLENKYILKENTRLIGIEFESIKPYRCAISYLGDESHKTNLPVSAKLLVESAVAFCILHGFKIIWISDGAFDINTDIFLKYTSVIEQGTTYYEKLKFELYGSTRLVPKNEYIASGINMQNDLITSAIFKNNSTLISFPGIDLNFQLFTSKKVKNIVYNLTFDCHSRYYKGCSEFYPLMKINKNYKMDEEEISENLNFLNNTNVSKSEIYSCSFMHDKTFKELQKLFPNECNYGKRIGECHKKIRNNIPCYDHKSCRYLIYLYENFFKPLNQNLIFEHFSKISNYLTKMAKPYYLQSIASLEYDMQIKKYHKENVDYENILLFILKNSIFYVSWVTSSEFWKRAIYVQDGLENEENINIKQYFPNEEKELFCPVAYAHEFIKHIFCQYMKFPNM